MNTLSKPRRNTLTNTGPEAPRPAVGASNAVPFTASCLDTQTGNRWTGQAINPQPTATGLSSTTAGRRKATRSQATHKYSKEHHSRGSRPCGWAKECARLLDWKKANPGAPESDFPPKRTTQNYLNTPRGNPALPLNHDCEAGLPIEATSRYASSHYDKGIPPCDWARDCASLYDFLRKNPGTTETDWPGRGARNDPHRGYKHNCDSQQTPIPNSNYVQEHYRRGTDPCRYSQECASLYKFLRKHPDKSEADWKFGYNPQSDPNRPYKHSCDPGQVIIPSAQPSNEHTWRKTESCEYARQCSSLRNFLRKHPDKSEADWPGLNSHIASADNQEHECGDHLKPAEPTQQPMYEHQYRRTVPCAWARNCSTLVAWLSAHPEAAVEDWPGVYQEVWQDGYYKALDLWLSADSRRKSEDWPGWNTNHTCGDHDQPIETHRRLPQLALHAQSAHLPVLAELRSPSTLDAQAPRPPGFGMGQAGNQRTGWTAATPPKGNSPATRPPATSTSSTGQAPPAARRRGKSQNPGGASRNSPHANRSNQKHDCAGGQPVEPTWLYYNSHKRKGEEPCEWAPRLSVARRVGKDASQPAGRGMAWACPPRPRAHLRRRQRPSD